MTESTREFFDTLAKVLIRCWILGVLLLLFTFGMFLMARDVIADVHGRMFGLTAHEIDVIFYCWMGLLKLFVNLLFLFPWIAIRWVLRKSTR